MYPADPIATPANGVYRLELTQSLDMSSGSIFDVRRIDTRQKQDTSENMVMQAYSGSEVPQFAGQYTASLRLGTALGSKWDSTNFQFGSYNQRWSQKDPATFEGPIVASDRAYVHGTNLVDIFTYTGTDQNGAYTTYNG